LHQVRKLHAEPLQRLALKCQVEYQEKLASKRQALLFKLKATTSINTITNTTTNIEMVMIMPLPMLDKEIINLKKIKQKLNQLFQSAMELMELQVLTASNQRKQRRALLRDIIITFKLVEMTKRKNSNTQDQTVSISQNFPSALE